MIMGGFRQLLWFYVKSYQQLVKQRNEKNSYEEFFLKALRENVKAYLFRPWSTGLHKEGRPADFSPDVHSQQLLDRIDRLQEH